MNDVELKALAVDYCEGKIFTSNHVEASELRSCFMVLALMESEQLKEFLEDCGFMYEYIKEASPVACNGMPTFFSVRKLTKGDTDKLQHFVNEYQRMKRGFFDTAPQPQPPPKDETEFQSGGS